MTWHRNHENTERTSGHSHHWRRRSRMLCGHNPGGKASGTVSDFGGQGEHQTQRMPGSRSQRIECLHHAGAYAHGLRSLCRERCRGNRAGRSSSFHGAGAEPRDREDGTAGARHPETSRRELCSPRQPQYQNQRRKHQALACGGCAPSQKRYGVEPYQHCGLFAGRGRNRLRCMGH